MGYENVFPIWWCPFFLSGGCKTEDRHQYKLQKFQENGEPVGRLLFMLNDKLPTILQCKTNICNSLVDKG